MKAIGKCNGRLLIGVVLCVAHRTSSSDYEFSWDFDLEIQDRPTNGSGDYILKEIEEMNVVAQPNFEDRTILIDGELYELNFQRVVPGYCWQVGKRGPGLKPRLFA